MSFYGDDFTGSTDVMEALAGHDGKQQLGRQLADAKVLMNSKNMWKYRKD